MPPPPPPPWPGPPQAAPPQTPQREELSTSLRRPPAPPWKKPLILVGLGLLALFLGLLVGRSIFRSPEAPSFEKEKSDTPEAPPVEAAQETVIDAPPAPSPTPAADTRGMDATAYELLPQLLGEWRLDLGSRRNVRVVFTNQEVSRSKQSGFEVRLYRCESDELPDRFSLVQLPDGGNFLAFHDDSGATRDVLENIESHGRDLFSFTEASSNRRKYARREGGNATAPTDLSDRGDGREPTSLPEPTWPAPEPEPSAPPEDPADEGTLSPADEQEIENLWRIAKAQRANKQWGPLKRTIDSLLEIDPKHPAARKWRREADEKLQDQNRDALDQVNGLLTEFASAVESRDMGELRGLWSGALDTDTSQFFTQLFRRYSRLQVEASLVSIRVDGKKTTGFEALVIIEGKDGRRRETEEYRWRADLRNGRIASSFP